MSLDNIMVDPKKLEITGIINWEMTNAVPMYQAVDYPNFLTPVVSSWLPSAGQKRQEQELDELRSYLNRSFKDLGAAVIPDEDQLFANQLWHFLHRLRYLDIFVDEARQWLEDYYRNPKPRKDDSEDDWYSMAQHRLNMSILRSSR